MCLLFNFRRDKTLRCYYGLIFYTKCVQSLPSWDFQRLPNRNKIKTITLESRRGRELCLLDFSKAIYYSSNYIAYIRFGSQVTVLRHS
jgi:hypothetical protein